MLSITLIDEFIQDLYAEAIETLTYVSLEPVERSNLTNSFPCYLHQPARHCLAQVKPKTKPTLRPRCRSFLLASGNANPNDDLLAH